MGLRLQGQRMLITGASSGIGRSLAIKAGQAGASLVLAARSADKLDEVAAQLRAASEVVVVPTDITIEADRLRLLDKANERFGGLDVLVNNAGVGSFGHFADSSEAILRQVMEVNFFAPAELIRAAVPILQRSTNPVIVNVASMCGRRGVPAWTEYSASKFALCGLTDALRAELLRFGIEVVLIVPGLTNTEITKHLLRNEGRAKIEHEKGMSPDEVADGILKSLAGRRRETVLGSEARWMLWVNKWLPRTVDSRMAQRVKQLDETSPTK